MAGKYGADLRKDPNPVIEKQATDVVRQIQPTRVTQVQAAPSSSLASVYNTTASLGYGTIGTLFIIPFNAETVDTDSMHDNVTNNTRITIATAKPGNYKIQARVKWINIVASQISDLRIRILVNGTSVASTAAYDPTVDGSHVQMLEHQQFMNGGQYFEVEARALGTDSGQDIEGGSQEITYAVVQSILG